MDGKAADAYALLALVAGQDVEPAEDSDGTDGRWRIARRVAPDRMISTVDPDTRHAHKTQARQQDGFKAHIVIEPDTGLITAAELTKASGPENSDGAVGARLIGMDPTIAGTSVDVLADSAYGSGEMLAALALTDHIPVIKPWPLRSAVAGGFTLDDFAVDEAAGTATCPNGITRTITAKRRVTFGAACTGCPLRDRCTASPRGRKLELHEHDALQREHRQRAADPAFQDTYRTHRPMVERSIAWLTRGNRRVPHRGITRNNAWLHLRIAGLNLRRLLNLGLRREPTGVGFWPEGSATTLDAALRMRPSHQHSIRASAAPLRKPHHPAQRDTPAPAQPKNRTARRPAGRGGPAAEARYSVASSPAVDSKAPGTRE